MARKKNSNSKPITAWTKAELIMVKVTMIIVGAIFLLMSFFAIVFLPVAAVCFWFAYACIKEQKRRKVAQAKKEAREAERQREKEEREAEERRKREAREAELRKYEFLTFKVAGVTFKNGRKTRQAILRAFKWGDEEIESISFEPYTYEGRPAVYVVINEQIVGNIPSEYTEKFYEMERLYKRVNVHCEVYGGAKLEDGSRTNYGCEVYIKYFKGEA